jgi:3D (Asp-Asp-Asp) domain-containing protein
MGTGMRRAPVTIERPAEAGVCFAFGVALAVAGSLGGQRLDERDEHAVAAAPRPAPVIVATATPVPYVEVEVAASVPAPMVAVPVTEVAAEPESPGRRLGAFALTRYYVVDEAKFAKREEPVLASITGGQVTIYDDRRCEAIATLPRRFVRELDMEGTGRLRDGRTINVSKERCGCARSPCYRVTGADARWGLSARGEPLEPFRTVAVDPDVIALGTRLYIAELDGLTMPGPAPWGGFVHDGCVIATDVGGRIRGRHVDFFVGRQVHKKAFDARWKLERVTVYRAEDRCGSVARDSGS